METDIPITTTETCYEELPLDYNNWSSTVIFFEENIEDIRVYAFDSEECIMYYVVSHKRVRYPYEELGYTAGDCKVFFVGEVILDEEHDQFIYPCDVKVYDIPGRQWMEGFPKLKYHYSAPFVFFLDGKLYVLSCGIRYGGIPYGDSCFQMLDINNFSEGWVSLSEPFFVAQNTKASYHDKIIDYSKKMLYVMLLGCSICKCSAPLYGYNVDHKEWCVNAQSLPYRSLNILKSSWSSPCVIVGDHLYRFQVYTDPNPRRPILIICDLEHEIEGNISAIEPDFVDVLPSRKVDLSEIVAPHVLQDLYAVGYLVYLGKKNSYPRFSLNIMYTCNSCSKKTKSYTTHLSTCTFDLRPSSRSLNEATAAGESSTESLIAKRISCESPHIQVDPRCLTFEKLCEVEDD